MKANGCTIAKIGTPSAPGDKYTPLLVSMANPQDPWRVLIEAQEDILLKPGHFMGRAGHGSFAVLNKDDALPDGMSNGWVFNRCTEYKKDTALRANGHWVLASGSEASTEPPVMRNLEIFNRNLVTVSRRSGRTPLREVPAASAWHQRTRRPRPRGFQSW